MIKEMEESNKQVRLIRKSSQKLLRVMDIQSEPGTEVQTEVAKVKHRQRDLSSSLRKRRSKVAKSLQMYGEFLELIEQVDKWLPEGTEHVKALELSSGEPEEIRKELDKSQVQFPLFLLFYLFAMILTWQFARCLYVPRFTRLNLHQAA